MGSVKVKTAQEYHSDTTRLTSRLFWAPPPRWTIVPAIILSFVGGLVLGAPQVDLVLRYSVVLFGVPTLLSAALMKSLVDLLGGKTYLRRTALLALIGLGLCVASLALWRGLSVVYSLASGGQWNSISTPPYRIMVVSWGLPLWLSLLTLLSTSDSRTARSFAPASVQTVTGYLVMWLFVPYDSYDVLFMVLVIAFFSASALLFAEIARRPMKKSFGFDGLWLMGQFLDHMTEREPAGQHKVEGFFESISMPAQVHLGVIAFGSPPRYKAVIVVPSAHPGPLGSLGGSDLPRKLSNQLSDISPSVLTPKGPCTHDQNIATKTECMKIGQRIKELLAGAEPLDGGSKSATATVGKATATAQLFGRSALIVCSLAPNPTDDLDSATGHAARQEAKTADVTDAIFVDAHNCMEVGSGLTHFGSRASHDIIEASRKAVEAAKLVPVGSMRLGYASRPYTANPDDGLGPLGVQVAVVEAGGQKTAYVLFDGNNMACGLREEIVKATKGLVDVTEVLTSDDHVVNMTMGGFNPVGMKMPHPDLVKMAEELVAQAAKDLASVKSSFATGYIDDLKVFGPEASARLATGINLTVAVLKPAVVLSLMVAYSLSILALLLMPWP